MSRPLESGIAVVALCLGLSSCFLIPGGGGGGGTGGGTASNSFTSGFATVRKDDRNLFVTDERDVNTPVQLTSTVRLISCRLYSSVARQASRVGQTIVARSSTGSRSTGRRSRCRSGSQTRRAAVTSLGERALLGTRSRLAPR